MLIVEKYASAPNLWAVKDTESDKYLYVHLCKASCEHYIINQNKNKNYGTDKTNEENV